MNSFRFDASIPASKSVLLRLLIARSYLPAGTSLAIQGESTCADVVHVTRALSQLGKGVPLDCGDSAMGFRLLALRASREPGRHQFTGSERLFQRPHEPLVLALRQLGVRVEPGARGWLIESEGWKQPVEPISVDGSFSSQFFSSLLANAWGLPFALSVRCDLLVSAGYGTLTLQLLRDLGMRALEDGHAVWVSEDQKVRVADVFAEPDLSSAFAVAALAAVSGRACLHNVTRAVLEESAQPDRRFPEYLEAMGADVRLDGSLRVEQADLRGIDVDLGGAPDLFPVLAALAACADGPSVLSGAPHLAGKESDRLQKVAELLTLAGVPVSPADGGLRVEGRPDHWKGGVFDPDHDHRMVMAATVLLAAGAPIEIDHAEVVGKSFPEFLPLLEELRCRR